MAKAIELNSIDTYDYLVESGAENLGEIEFPDGTKQIKFDDTLWDQAKAIYCQENGIDLH